MITEKEYKQQYLNWKGTIFKTMFKLSQINKLDYSYQQDLLQVGKIAVYEALIASQTNGKTGNDKNGLIAAYIDGKMKTFANRTTDVIRVPNALVYDQEKREENAHWLPVYQPAEWHNDTTEDFIEEEQYDDMDWIDKEAIKYALAQLTPLQYSIVELKFGLNGKEPMMEKDIAKQLNIRKTYINSFIHKVLPALAQDRQIRLQVNQRKKYGSAIQSITKKI